MKPIQPRGLAVPTIPVIIPTLNEEAHVATTIRSLVPSSRELRCRFVVVDGGSTDLTIERALALRDEGVDVTILTNSRRNQAAAVNLAVEALTGDELFVRCDAHANYPTDYVLKLVESMSRTGADSTVVVMDSVGKAPVQRAVAWLSDSRIGNGGSAHRGGRSSGWVKHGHHALFRVEAFRKVGGYREWFVPNEDAELDSRLTSAGCKIYLDSEIRMEYFARSTLKALYVQYFRYGAGRARTSISDRSTLSRRHLILPGGVLLVSSSFVVSPWRPKAALIPLVYLFALTLNSINLGRKHRSMTALLCVPASIVMHFGWTIGFLWDAVRCRRHHDGDVVLNGGR